ncbi:hypothetical protein ACFPTX_19045 [Pseudomonas sp. GCM10022188]|uniref:hypothetical protein n=1 Tax=Pseudomonas TaxID=286 RepID=UPI001E3AD777|nr:hypothetical protein [Pseudomonas oryzagri]MCC6073872.1 hypothetical protein [Pseudomonas oryzagri]
MYAVIRKYQFDQGLNEDLDRKIQEAFVPLIKKVPGFVAYYWLNNGNGTGASFSVFQDKAGAEESVRVAAGFVAEQLGAQALGKPEITEGVVQAHG